MDSLRVSETPHTHLHPGRFAVQQHQQLQVKQHTFRGKSGQGILFLPQVARLLYWLLADDHLLIGLVQKKVHLQVIYSASENPLRGFYLTPHPRLGRGREWQIYVACSREGNNVSLKGLVLHGIVNKPWQDWQRWAPSGQDEQCPTGPPQWASVYFVVFPSTGALRRAVSQSG